MLKFFSINSFKVEQISLLPIPTFPLPKSLLLSSKLLKVIPLLSAFSLMTLFEEKVSVNYPD